MTHRAEEELLEARDAARRAGVSLDTVRRRLRAGEFPRATRDQGANAPWRIPLGDLIASGLIAATPLPSGEGSEGPPEAFGASAVVGHLAVLEEVVAVLGRQIYQLKQAIERGKYL